MSQLPKHEAPDWAKPGSSWVPKVCWPMLCLTVALLVWRIVDGGSPGKIMVPAGTALVFVCVLISNLSTRRRSQNEDPHRPL
ncbi:hypothetical protein K377_07858 [Streptomyces sp. PsTaAH-137]|nr:hypothetical protein K377_07858 [Streptomyces sp. PsTaAH-137]